jgi:hypothetical protein
MKKMFMTVMSVICFLCGCEYTVNVFASRKVAEQAQDTASKNSDSIPIPTVSYFQERRTIAKWAQRWDKPAIATYVYLINNGVIIGYYVTDGKPASTRSYLVPEDRVTTRTSTSIGTSYDSDTPSVVTAPDIDGTYGENNVGIRFFTADGAAVEWGGVGACYIYSDALLPVNVPKLNPSK